MNKSTKIAIATMVSCAAALSLSLTSCKRVKADKNQSGERVGCAGVLSYLNMDEAQYKSMRSGIRAINEVLEEEGYLVHNSSGDKSNRPASYTIRYYDTLDALLMALKADEIDSINGLPQTTARYLCARNPSLKIPYMYEIEKEREKGSFVERAFGRVGNGFSFMMLEKNVALRDQLNSVIAEMEKDGTRRKLVHEQILGAINGKEIKAVPPEYKEGRETIKVAVTGALPPMDYVAADGSFAGFNTALLAEIGKRLDKNIVMVQVSSVGRATALASGTVDMAFWTRGQNEKAVHVNGKQIRDLNETEYAEMRKNCDSSFSEKEVAAMQALTKGLTGNFYGDARTVGYTKDMPENTISTDSYFTDMPVVVVKK